MAIPGNHDSAARLSFGTPTMGRARLHSRTAHDGERIAVWPLPFLAAGDFDSLDDEARGMRTIGIVSQVAEPRARMPYRIEMSKGRSGSTLRLVN